MASRKIEDLVPELQEKFYLFKEEMEKAGLYFIVTCTARTIAEQIMLYCQGRMNVKYVNKIRLALGYPPITRKQNRVVTWTLKSKHIVYKPGDKARAFDIALLTSKRRVHWNLKEDVNKNEIPDYIEAARIGRKVGLIPGADWGDYCHFEI